MPNRIDVMKSDPAMGYSRLSIVVHWLAAIIVITLFATHEGRPGSMEYAIHVGGGAVVGLFLLWRVWYRVRRGLTAKANQAVVLNWASRIVIWGFLATITVLVVTGYLLPWSLGRPIEFGGLFSIPSPLPQSRSLHEFVEEGHEVASDLIVPLFILHILGAAKHAFFDRDGIASRMIRPLKGGRRE